MLHACTHICMHVWRSEDKLWESGLSSDHMGAGNWTQVVGLISKSVTTEQSRWGRTRSLKWNKWSQEIFNKYLYQKIRSRYKTTVKAFIVHNGKKGGEMSIFEQPVCAWITDRLVWEESQVHFIPFEIAVLFQDSLLRKKIKTLHTNCQSR